jgi:spore germination protein KB
MFTEKINSRQLFYLLFISRTTVAISFLPSLTSADALQDAWLSALLSFLPGGGYNFAHRQAGAEVSGKGHRGVQRRAAGSNPWKIAASSLPFSFLIIVASTDLRLYAGVIKTGFLTETPLVVIAGIMMLAVVAVVYAGLEPLGRCADVIFPVFLMLLIAGLLFPLVRADFQNLQPVLARGWSPVIMGSIIPTMITAAQYLHMSIIVPSLVEPQKALRAALWSYVLSTAVLVLYSVLVISVLGAEEGARSSFPVFRLLRAVRFSRFWERVEAVNIFSWGLGVFITVALGLYFSAWVISRLLGLRKLPPASFPPGCNHRNPFCSAICNHFRGLAVFYAGDGRSACFFSCSLPPGRIMGGLFAEKAREREAATPGGVTAL